YASNTPTLQVFRSLKRGDSEFPFFAPDYDRGGRLATEHLLEMGSKRIAFMGGLEGRAVTEERMSGYLSVLAEIGMEPVILTGQATRGFGKATAAKLLAENPEVDGVICFNDLVALGVLSAGLELGVRIGTELRVVGFDDIEDCKDSYPPLTSVSCNIPDFAKSTANQILAWVKDGTAPSVTERSPVALVRRASSGA
ncbi:MAG: substrate-binding domain-containing protein, partial [Paracoccaceae bacterium]